MSGTAHLHVYDQPVRYARAVSIQEDLVARRLADEIPDTFLLLEHHPVITLGRRGRREHLLISEEQLKVHDIDLEPSARGDQG